jgi:hypothetical protein
MAQPKHWVEFTEDWRNEPLAFWVHIEQDGQPWFKAERFLPEAPRPVPHKGYPVLCVEFMGMVLRFSSREQLGECIRVLSLNPLPTTRRLSELRGSTLGSNSHWLSRLPGRLKSPKARRVLVAALTAVENNGT